MIKSKYVDIISIFCCAAAVLFTLFCFNSEVIQAMAVERTYPYTYKLFDDSWVHSIDIILDDSDWQGILENPTEKEYVAAVLIIDGETYKNVGFRTKGNTSLSTVASMDSDRYSFKIEFDHYDSNTTYYGLDKITLNNIIQDTTYMKDYLSYHMFNEIGTASPLSSFASITINGEAFGLYLAVEAVEETFLMRTYGSDRGKLYKPDNMQMGGGSGNRRDDSGSLKYNGDALEGYGTLWDGAVFKINDSDKTRLIQSLKTLNEGMNLEEAVDVEAVLKYFVVHNFVLNFDSYTGNMLHNYYLYEVDGILTMIPWDYNLAFGGFSMGGNGPGGEKNTGFGENGTSATTLVNYPIDTPLSGAALEDRPMLGKLLENEAYLALYHQYFDEFIATYFESGRFEEEYDRIINLIKPYVAEDPTAFVAYEEFLAGSETLKEFCLLRAESIRGQLNGTIPSTSTGQQADSSTLIQADHISINDMGSMGGAGGGPGMFGRQGGNREDLNFSGFDDIPQAIPSGEASSAFAWAAFGENSSDLERMEDIPGAYERLLDDAENQRSSEGKESFENIKITPQETEIGGFGSDEEEEHKTDRIPDDENEDREKGNPMSGLYGGMQGGGPNGGMSGHPMFGGQGGFSGTMDFTDGGGDSGSEMSMVYLLIGCAAALLFGYGFVLRYRRF